MQGADEAMTKRKPRAATLAGSLGLVLDRLPLWKRGVTRLDDFARMAIERESRRIGWWPFSFELLANLPDGKLDAFHEALVERIYRAIAAGPAVYKITEWDRFAELDRELLKVVDALWPGREIVVHDMAVSSGVTSLALFRRLSGVHPTRMFASDNFDAIFVVDHPSSRWKGVFDRDGKLLQIVSPKLVLSGYRPELMRHPFNRMAQWWTNRSVVPAMRDALARIPHVEPGIVAKGWRVREVRLFHPEVVREAADTDRFTLLRHSVFDANPIEADIVRLMNVLTPNHFPESEVLRGLQQSVRHLREGGLMVIGRTSEAPRVETRATAYRSVDGRLKPVLAMDGGYEWPEIVAQVRTD